MKAKEESEKVGLKLNVQKTKIIVSGPVTSWQTGREDRSGTWMEKRTIREILRADTRLAKGQQYAFIFSSWHVIELPWKKHHKSLTFGEAGRIFAVL